MLNATYQTDLGIITNERTMPLGWITNEVTDSLGLITNEVTDSLGALRGEPTESTPWKWMVLLSGVVGAAALSYHGYRRHHAILPAIGWGILGAIFPVNLIAGGVAIAQLSCGKHPKR